MALLALVLMATKKSFNSKLRDELRLPWIAMLGWMGGFALGSG